MSNINHYDLLNFEDQEMEAAAHGEIPALSSGLNVTNQWESFNTWLCFSTETVQPECSELDNGALHVPTLRIRQGSTLYDFSLDPEPSLNCEQILEKWISLIQNQRSFCVYAAQLQIYPNNPFESDGIEEWQLWIVDQIKTHNGYWKREDPEKNDQTTVEQAISADTDDIE
jgi:hypothetical protein